MNKYQVKIDTHYIHHSKVYYHIVVDNEGFTKQSKKRYSDLKELHEKLQAKVNNYKLHIQLPIFPGRKLFGRTNDNPDSIKQRGKELQDYLQAILNQDKLHQFESIKSFLPDASIEESIVVQSNSEYSKDKCWSQMDELKRSFLERQDKIFQSKTAKNIRSSPLLMMGYTQRYYFSFDDYKESNDTIIYTCTLTDAKHNKSYKFYARYSDLREYHLLLKKRKFSSQLPKFPKRKILGQTKDNPLEIQERQELLQNYWNQIFSTIEFEKCEIMRIFIDKIKLESIQVEEPTKRNSNPPFSENPYLSADVIVEKNRNSF